MPFEAYYIAPKELSSLGLVYIILGGRCGRVSELFSMVSEQGSIPVCMDTIPKNVGIQGIRKGIERGKKPTQTKKVGIGPGLLHNDRLCAGLLKSRPWIAYSDETRSSELRLSL